MYSFILFRFSNKIEEKEEEQKERFYSVFNILASGSTAIIPAHFFTSNTMFNKWRKKKKEYRKENENPRCGIAYR